MDEDDIIILSNSSSESEEIINVKSKENVIRSSKLIDSEESEYIVGKKYSSNNLKTDIHNTNDLVIERETEKKWSDSEFTEVNFNCENDFRNNSTREPQSDSDYETENPPNNYWVQCMEKLITKPQLDVELSSEDENLFKKNDGNIKCKGI
jgi:hypothetical protein